MNVLMIILFSFAKVMKKNVWDFIRNQTYKTASPLKEVCGLGGVGEGGLFCFRSHQLLPKQPQWQLKVDEGEPKCESEVASQLSHQVERGVGENFS